MLGLIGVSGWLWWAYGLNHQFFTDRGSEMTVLTSTDIPVPLQLEILHLEALFYAVPVAITAVVALVLVRANRRSA